MNQQHSFARRVVRALGSTPVFWVVIGWFVLEAVWIALSGRYPMAFDEDFHLGIIRLYAHHLSPFWSNQPPNADVYGAVARDPSYLYHYLMSFPYRLISAFTADQTIQVLLLRALNIGLFVSGLVLFRNVLRQIGASQAVVNYSFAVFALIPVMPLLAAQINYDNLLFPLTALALLLTIRVSHGLRLRKPLDTKVLLELLIVCLLASLVKYAFLPIFLAIVGYLVVRLWQSYRSWRQLAQSLGFGFTLMSRWLRWLLVVGLLLSGGLFLQRDGYNLARYHTPVPDCSKVLDVEACSDYGPWIRDYHLKLNKAETSDSPVSFTGDWLHGMWLRLFFAVDGPTTQFQTKGPFLVPALAGIVLPAVGLLFVITQWRRLLRTYDATMLWLLVSVSGLYVATLWADEYLAFLRTGQPVAINGRYLLPVLLPLLAITALAVSTGLRDHLRLKLGLATVAIISLLLGGGGLTYILRSNEQWYWPSQLVRDANHAVQQTIGPLIPGYYKQNQFLR